MPGEHPFVPPGEVKIATTSVAEQYLGLTRDLWERRTPALLLKKITPFLERQGMPESPVREQFEQEKNTLATLFGDPKNGLKNNLLFHGTGAYKFAGKKYSGQIDQTATVPVLETILKEGLKPQFDAWMPDADMHSLSFAESYFYSKWYASKYMGSDTELQWQLGDTNDWFLFAMADTVRDELSFKNAAKTAVHRLTHWNERQELKQKRRKEVASGQLEKLYQWIATLRTDVGPKTALIDLYSGHSTIPDNFGAVLGIDQKFSATFRPAYGGAHEVRSTNAVEPNLISAVGVPLRHLDETKKIIKKTPQRPILFSLEGADLYLSKFPIETLTKRIGS